MSSQEYEVNNQRIKALLAWAGIDDFQAFLVERRQLMSAIIEKYYRRL